MKKIVSTLALISMILLFGACSKTPEVANNKPVESLKTLVINPAENVENDQIVVKTGDNIKTLVKKVTGMNITNQDERQIYTHLDSLNGAYPLSLNGIHFKSYDRSISYEALNRITACILTKDLEIIYKGDSTKLRVCKTRYSHWIIR